MTHAVLAHGQPPAQPALLWQEWRPDLVMLAWVVAAALVLLANRHPRQRIGFIAAGLAALSVALLSPLDAAATVLFSAHMAQHLLLTAIAAPLLVIGAAHRSLVRTLPSAAARALGGAARRLGSARPHRAPEAWLAGATVAHLLVMAVWHAPALYQAGLAVGAIHTVQHATMLASAVGFWAAVVLAERRGALLAALLALVVASVFGVGLGALLTLAPAPLYDQLLAPEAWNISALADQQVAGLLMWVPGGIVYLAGVVVVLHCGLTAGPPRRSPSPPSPLPVSPLPPSPSLSGPSHQVAKVRCWGTD